MRLDQGLLDMRILIGLADGLPATRLHASGTSPARSGPRRTGLHHVRLWHLRLAFAVTAVVAAVLVVVGSVAALALKKVLAHRRGPVGRWMLRFGARLVLRVATLTGLVRCDLPALAELAGPHRRTGLLLVANHPSRLDALFMIASVPGLVCVTKASIWDRTLFSAAIRMAGYPRAGDDRHLATAATALLEGRPVLVFPEGTRSPPGGPGRFHPGFACLARQAQVPIQAVMIETDSDFLGRNQPLLRVPARPVRIVLRAGARFDPPGNRPGDMRRLALAVELAFHETPASPLLEMAA